jgi:hypothetical protein
MINQKFPDWLKIKEHSSEGILVILNKQTPMSEINKKIETFSEVDISIN